VSPSGRAARTTTVLIPRATPDVAYVRGERLGRLGGRQLSLVQVRPAISMRRASGIRINVDRARRRGCTVITGELLLWGDAAGPGRAIVSASLVRSQVDETPSFSSIQSLGLSPALIERLRPVLRLWVMTSGRG